MLEIILEGEKSLEASLIKIYEAICREVSDILLEASIEAYITARQAVPVRTGRLRDSISLEKLGRFKFRVVAGYPTKEKGKPYYAPFIEFGTRRMTPRPFMKPAVDKALAKIESRLNFSKR